ncbi:MAG TPA: HAMP domain-containing sensor histidine kinase [Aestuariivirga sp.]|nr:HAMP domain-containing sensor histidine kinase [Aestuariivirga sp.]
MQQASSAYVGYLAILLAGLLLCLGVRYEANRQYLVAWQQYLEARQVDSKDYTKRVGSFFSALNDNLGTLSSLPSVRKIDRHGINLGVDGQETIQRVYNNLAKNIAVTKLYIVPLNFDSKKMDLATGQMEKPILELDRIRMRSKSTGVDVAAEVLPPSGSSKAPEFQEMQKQLDWLKINYPDIQRVKTSAVPMISGREIATGGDSGLVFSVPFFDEDGTLAGSVAAVILSGTLRGITEGENYSLISPLADYISVPLSRDKNIRLMYRAANTVPAASTVFSETVVVDTHDARGKWQLRINYPVTGFYSGTRFRARKDFENGSYLALGLLMLLGLGWHRTTLKRSEEMRKSSKALQLVNDDITRLNIDLAEKMRQLREAHDEIIKKGKLAQMGQLVATVAHELRNPLSAVRTSAYLLKRKLAGHSVNVDTQLERIDNSVARCDAVITQFLDYAKSHHLEYKEFPFDNWVVKLIEEEAQKLPEVIQVECNLGLDGVSASFDPNRLSRVIINLISNASEAMVGKGDDPKKFKTQTPKISVVTRQSQRGIEIDVSDNGPGIAEEQIPKILEPLFTTKSFGTGLGLPAAIQVLEQHRGGLQINGGLGKGATFTAWIPVSPGQVQAA